jgi:hypothetical protein
MTQNIKKLKLRGVERRIEGERVGKEEERKTKRSRMERRYIGISVILAS